MAKLHFNALVIESTERCNARCAMCYQAAGPKGSDIRGDSELDLAAIERIIDQAIHLPNLGKRVHLSGRRSASFATPSMPVSTASARPPMPFGRRTGRPLTIRRGNSRKPG